MGVLAARFLNYAALLPNLTPVCAQSLIRRSWRVRYSSRFAVSSSRWFSILSLAGLSLRQETRLVAHWMDAHRARHSVNVRHTSRINRTHDLYHRADPVSAQRLAGNRAQATVTLALPRYWVNHSARKWLNWFLGIVFFVAMILPILGLLMRRA
jgi:hypothetical protein